MCDLPPGANRFVTGTELARLFGVSEATMSRDLRAVRRRFEPLIEILARRPAK